MKKYLFTLSLMLLFLTGAFCAKAEGVDITINGSSTTFENKAFILNDRTYVPMREIFEKVGATVLWDDFTKSATAHLKNTSVTFKIDSNTVTKNGVNYWSDSSCKLIDGKTYVPIRIILELLGFSVNWNEKEQNVDISAPPSIVPETGNSNSPPDAENSFVNSSNEYEQKVLELVNKERNNRGLNNLSMDENLSHVARLHSKDMYQRNFFNHTNPDGLTPFDRMKNFGITFMRAAENIAAGQTSPEEVVKSWMNSEGHKENILNPDYNKIGIGYYKSDGGYRHYWTQCFTD